MSSNSIESIFESIPVDEGPSKSSAEGMAKKDQTPARDMGDRVSKGSMEDRIEAFGTMLDDPDYSGKKKEHEPVKVEKEKMPVAPKESVDSAKEKKEVQDEQEDEEGDSEEESDTDEGVDKSKDGQKEIEVPKDKKFKVKVDGQDTDVTLEELMNGYSGKQAISKRFTELDKEKKTFQKDKEQILADQKYIQKEVQDLKGSFAVAIEEFKKNGFNTKNPLESLDTLLDRLGVDSYHFNRAAFEYNLPEYEKYLEMSDIERDAYFVKKENEFFKKKEKSFEERTHKAQSEQERQRKEFDLIKRSGLSIESYNTHFDELEALGAEDLSAEKVLEFAKVKPIFDKAGDIVSKTSKANDIALIQDVSKILLEFPNTTEEEIIEHIEGKAAVKKAQKVLKDKENFTLEKKNKKSSSSDSFFTDEEMAEFQEMRRR